MKKIYLFLMMLVTSLSFGQPVITAIVDGTCSGGTPKMIEIFAQGQVDFSQYSVQKQSNGNGFSTTGTFDLSVFGTVTDDYVYIYNAADETAFLAEFPSATSKSKENTGFASGNGDDAFRIVDSSNNTIDTFGIENEDGSGKFWEYLDSYAKRNTGAPASATIVQADWTFGGPNFLDGKCGGNTFEVEMGGIQTYYEAPATGPYFTEDFENGGTFPAGWTLTNGTHDWQIDDGTTHGPGAAQEGTYCAYFDDYNFSTGITADMVTPTIDLSNATNPELTFWYWDNLGSYGDNHDTVEILVSTDGTLFTNVLTTPATVASWTKFTVDLTAYAGQASLSIAFRGTSIYGYSDPHVDNIKVAEAPACFDPTGLTVDSVSINSATVSWTDAGGDSGNYKVEYKVDGTSTWTVDSTNATSPYTISGLLSATTYNWQLTKDCGASGTSLVVSGPDFTTECPTITALPILLDFENVTTPDLPTCISVETTTNATWKTVDASASTHPSIGTAHSGNNVVYFNSYSASSNKEAKLISPNFALPNTTNVLVLSYYMYHDSGYASSDDRVQVQIFDGTNWVDVGNPVSRNNGNSGWAKESVDISAYANQTIKVALNGISGYGNDIFVDDIELKEVTCPSPTSISIDTRSTNTIDLSWAAGGSESDWKITWGAPGFTPDFSATTNVADVTGTPSYQIIGLSEATSYEVYLMSDCGSGDTSEVVGPISTATVVSNNDCTNAMNLTVYDSSSALGNEITQNTLYATASTAATNPSCDGYGTNLDVYYTFTVPAGVDTVVMETGGDKGGEIEAALYDSCGGTELACEGNSDIKTFTGLTSGSTYIIQAWHDDFNAGEFNLLLYYPPANNDCAGAIDLTVYTPAALAGNETAGSTLFATPSSLAHTSCDGYGDNMDLFYTFTVPAEETSVSVITGGTTGGFLEAALYDSCGGTEIACIPVWSTPKPVKTFTDLTPGATYTLQVWHDAGANQGDFTIGVVAPINDECDASIDLTVYPIDGLAGNEISGSTTNATASQYAHTSCDPYGTNLDLFYTFTVPTGETDVRILTAGAAGDDIELAIYDACGGNEIECMSNGSDHIVRGLTSDTSYVLQIWHDSFNAGAFTIGMEVAPPPPANDDCVNAIALPLYNFGQSVGHELAQSTSFATAGQYAHTSCDGVGTNLDLFYTFMLPPGETKVRLLTSGDKGAEIEAALYDSCGGAEIACMGNSSEKVFTGLTGGQQYTLQVWHDSFNAGDFNIALEKAPTAPSNDVCSGAWNLAVYPAGASAGNETNGHTGYATESGVAPSCDSNATYDLFYKFTVPTNQTDVNILTAGATGDDLVISLTDACGGVEVTCEDSGNTHIVRGLTSGSTYYVQAAHTQANTGLFNIAVEIAPAPPANDDCANATVVNSLPYINIMDATYATGGVLQGGCSNGMNDGVWYTFTGDGANVTIIATPDGWDNEIGLYSGTCGNLVCEARKDVYGAGHEETLVFATTAGTQYLVNIGHYTQYSDQPEGPFTITIESDIVGISDNNIEGFTYFPNPVSNVLNLQAQDNISNVSIFDITGKEVMNITPNDLETQIDMSNLRKGIYFVKVVINEQITAIKVAKE